MGHVRIELTPYLKIKKIKMIDILKIKRICPNHPNFNTKDHKFCPNCGTEIINKNYTEKEELSPYKVFEAAGLEEDNLFLNGYDNILMPNHTPPNKIRIDEDSNGEINLNGKQELIDTQILWFKEKYRDYIKALEDAYGSENIEICWGLLHYWS